MTTKTLFLFVIAMILLIVLCYFYVDRAMVWFLYKHYSREMILLKTFATRIISLLTAMIMLTSVYLFIKTIMRKLSSLDLKLLTCIGAVAIGNFCCGYLKFIFGRYWPATFICNNPSLINNHVYGFNWFKSGEAFHAFPSEHATFIAAFATTMWALFPKLRWLAASLIILVIWGQLGMYYEFVSDVLGGILLGSLVGVGASLIYKHTRNPTN